MSSTKKFYLISLGGLIGMLVLGMILAPLFSTPEEINKIELSATWLWFRLAFYVVVILAWEPICNFMTKKSNTASENKKEVNEKRANDIKYLISIRWKVAFILIFFEVVIIHQFGTRSLW